ncbi:MAG: DegT/DnrJ/EryC1/StrS family aminotransferase, partial [Planctomyces sp.]
DRTKMLRQYVWQERNRSEFAGVNSRLDELQAAILRVRLKGLDAANERRQAIAAVYDRGLRGLPLQLPGRRPDCRHVYHQYVIQTPERGRIQARLREAGVSTMVHYPHPVHLQPAYASRLPQVDPLTNTERIVPQVLSLPMFPEMTETQASAVVRAVIAATG